MVMIWMLSRKIGFLDTHCIVRYSDQQFILHSETLVILCTQNCFGLIGLWRNACPLRGGSLKSSYYNWPVARPIRLRDGPVVLLRNHGSTLTAQFLKIFDRYGSTFFVYFLCPESSSLMELE